VEQVQGSILISFRIYPCGRRTRRHLVEHEEDSFKRGERKHFFTGWVASFWKLLPQELREGPCQRMQEVFKQICGL